MKNSSKFFVLFLLVFAFLNIYNASAAQACLECEDNCGAAGRSELIYYSCRSGFGETCQSCCLQKCSTQCDAQCESDEDCMRFGFGSCRKDTCGCCGNWNDPDTLGCCPGLAAWGGKCCNWGEDVDCGRCHEPCEGNQIYDCKEGCKDPLPDPQGTCIDVPRDSWAYYGPPYTGGCGKCGTVERLCDNLQQYTDQYRCVNEGSCSPGQTDAADSGCGKCGEVVSVCQSNCQWASTCVGDNPSAGQSCGSCGRGTEDCNCNCNSDYSNCGSEGWYDVGGCENCGTY